jgi:hypothetical protein
MLFIKKNKADLFVSLLALIKKIGLSQIKDYDILAWGEVYGRLLYTNHTGIYRDDEFENLLVETYLSQNGTPTQKENCAGELHIITSPLSTGGHTRLMERMIDSRTGADVLITRPVSGLGSRLFVSPKVKIWHTDGQFDLPELINIISRYKTVFLHINPDDLLASVAVAVAKKSSHSRVIFVNHADHIFSFGFYAADIVAEVSSYGFLVSECKRNVASSFLGIPINFSLLDQIDQLPIRIPSKRFEIMSAGSRLKYRPSRNHSLPNVAMMILKHVPTARIVVIGPSILLDSWWWTAMLRYPKRLKILRPMPYQLYLDRITKAHLYIDSTPMTGGTTIPEIRSRAIAVTGITSASCGYSPLDATRFTNTKELVHAIQEYSLTGAGPILEKNNNSDTLKRTVFVHGRTSFEQRLNNIVIGLSNALPPDALSRENINYYRDQWQQCGVVNFDYESVYFLLKYRQILQMPIRLSILVVSAIPKLLVRYLIRLLKLYP